MSEPGEGWLAAETFELVRRSVPVACVDVLPWRRTPQGPSVLLIERLDRDGDRGWCLVGGRIRIDESIEAAIGRHIADTLGDIGWTLSGQAATPVTVAEYDRHGTGPAPFDPAQHAIALNYLVELGPGQPLAQGEALALGWFAPAELPAPAGFGFGQAPVAARLAAAAQAAA